MSAGCQIQPRQLAHRDLPEGIVRDKLVEEITLQEILNLRILQHDIRVGDLLGPVLLRHSDGPLHVLVGRIRAEEGEEDDDCGGYDLGASP